MAQRPKRQILQLLNTLKSQLKTVMAVDDNAIYTDEDKDSI